MDECPECGTLVTSGHARCPSCGHDLLEASRSCERCGETIAADAEACPACGALREPARCDRHPDREALGRCALCGVTLCESCDAGRSPYYQCEDHADVPIVEGWAQVLSLADEVQAHLIEENLRAEGIDARVLSQKDVSAFPVGFGELSKVRVLVPTHAWMEAERVLEAHSDAVGEVTFGCPNCGEPYDEAESVCSKCGEALV